MSDDGPQPYGKVIGDATPGASFEMPLPTDGYVTSGCSTAARRELNRRLPIGHERKAATDGFRAKDSTGGHDLMRRMRFHRPVHFAAVRKTRDS